MKKNIIITILAVIFCIGGVAIAAEVMNFYGNTTVNFPNEVVGGAPEDTMVGDVTPTGGICNGSEPATTMCNISAYELGVETDVTIDDDLTVTGNFSADGIDEDWIEGTCADATTTPIQVVNPWSADAYVDKFLLVLTNGTTTITFDIGTSTAADNLSTEVIADDVEYATSTYALLYNSAGTIAGTAGYKDPGTNSQDFFTWRSGEYINMVVTEVGTTGGVTGGANTFACTYKIHSFK